MKDFRFCDWPLRWKLAALLGSHRCCPAVSTFINSQTPQSAAVAGRVAARSRADYCGQLDAFNENTSTRRTVSHVPAAMRVSLTPAAA